MNKRVSKLPDFHLTIYDDNGKAKRIASLWIYDDPKKPDKEATMAKGKAETTITIPMGKWVNLFPVQKGLLISVKPPNRY